MDERMRIIEDSLNIGIAELAIRNERSRQVWKEALSPDRLAMLDSRLAAYYVERQGALPPPYELYPALFESEMYYNFGGLSLFGPPRPPRTAVINEDLRQALLYGHGVVLYDPLLGVSQMRAPNQRGVVMQGAIQFWHEFGDLVETKVIQLEPPDYQLFPRVLDAEECCLDLICQSREGRKELLDLFEELNETFTDQHIDWIGRVDQPDRVNRARADRFRKHIGLVELCSQDMFHAVRLDLDRFLFSQLLPSADLWLPSEQHLGYYLLLAQYGLGHLDLDLEFILMQGLTTVYLPGLNDFPLRDVVSLRRDSEVLEAWRRSLREALAELAEVTRRGLGEDSMRRQLRNHMDDMARQTSTALRRERSAPFTSATRAMTFGAVGASVGAAFDGIHGFLVGTAAGAASNVAQAATSFLATRARREALKSRVQHAVLFGDAEPGETTEERRHRVLRHRMGHSAS